MIGGQMLADVGVDVIKVEPPGGSPSRKLGPFYKDRADPECSLFWFAYNAGKKSITLNLQAADGQAILKKLIPKVDFFGPTASTACVFRRVLRPSAIANSTLLTYPTKTIHWQHSTVAVRGHPMGTMPTKDLTEPSILRRLTCSGNTASAGATRPLI